VVGGVVSGSATYTIASFGNLSLEPSAADGFVALMTYNFRDLTPVWSKVYKVGGTGSDNVRSVQISPDGYVFIAGEFRSSDLRFQDLSTQAVSRSCTALHCSDLYMMELGVGTSSWTPRWSRKISSTGLDFLSGLLLSDITGGYVYGRMGAGSASAGLRQTLTGERSTNNAFLTRVGAEP
jgi:WD40 repeat protein